MVANANRPINKTNNAAKAVEAVGGGVGVKGYDDDDSLSDLLPRNHCHYFVFCTRKKAFDVMRHFENAVQFEFEGMQKIRKALGFFSW